MSGKDKQVIEKIIKHIERILKYSHGVEVPEEFEKNELSVDACVYNLLQIGELAKVGLSDDVKQQIEGVQWNRIYGIRERVMDERAGVRIDVVWNMARERLPILLTELKTCLKESETR